MSLVLTFLLMLAYNKWKNFLALPVTFLLYWTLIVFFSKMRLHQLYAVSTPVYIMVLLSCVSFFLGACLADNRKQRKKLNLKHKQKIVIGKRANGLFILSVIVVGIQVTYMIPSLVQSGMAYTRYFTLSKVMAAIGSLGTVIGYLGLPFLRTIAIVILIKMTLSTANMRDICMLAISVVMVLLSQGGRTSLMQLMIAVVYLIVANRKRLTPKVKRTIRNGGVLAASGMILITVERGGNIWNSLYRYYCGALVYLTKALNTSIFSGDLFYGFCSFQGLFRPIFGITRILGFQDPTVMERADEFIIRIQFAVLPVSVHDTMNFFVTCFGYMYRDGGYWGVAIISLLFGALCSIVERLAIESNNHLRWKAMKIIFLQGICFTMINFPFADYNTVMSMVYIFLITTKKFPKIVFHKEEIRS